MLIRILVAGERGDDLRRVRRVADRLDALVTPCEGEEALRARVSRRPADLVLLDGALRDSTDALIELVDELQRDGRRNVVTYHRSDDPETRSRLLAAGCLAVVRLDVGDELLGEALLALVERKREEARLRQRRVPGQDHGLADYAFSSPAMHRFLSVARRVAMRDSTVLILGETGVGKGLLARSIHNEGPRSDGPFVSVNCGAIHESLAESELFGHEKGSFTGAERYRRGRFEAAHGGTLFLDEVGELPHRIQVKLLTALEDGSILPVGSENALDVDVRLIAASNRDLAEEVEQKRFRADLFYRLNVVSLTIPPLRERREDIVELAESYLRHFSERLHADLDGFSDAAMDALCRYEWPGNVRELINAIERAVLMCAGDRVEVDDLPSDVVPDVGRTREVSADDPKDDLVVPPNAASMPWSEVRQAGLLRLEREYLVRLLRAVGGRINEASDRAAIDPRSLYDKMKKHGLRKEDFRSS